MTSATRYLESLDRLWLGLTSTVAFLLLAIGLGFFTPGFEARHQAISALSLGPLGGLQDLSFVVLGLALLGTVPAWRYLLSPGRGGTAYPALTALMGLCFLLFPLLPQDPAPGYDPAGLHLERPTLIGLLHLAVAAVAALAQVLGLGILARRFATTPTWRRWAAPTLGIALLMVVCIAIYGVWSVQPTGFAGTFERLAVLVPASWAWAVFRRLSRGALPP